MGLFGHEEYVSDIKLFFYERRQKVYCVTNHKTIFCRFVIKFNLSISDVKNRVD